tara:strand:- start:20 stop:685 length:666 start_codon:yes stop_codon:yes gene_type:complete
MDYLIHQLLDKKSTKLVVDKVLSDKQSWEDGKKTAGSHASKVKSNSQLNRDSTASIDATNVIINVLESDPLIKSFCLPKIIHGLMFSRSNPGDGYGTHVDNPYMSSGRSDLSFTLFLNSKEDYEGGELSIQSLQENKRFKLEAGQIIIYPSTKLHSVQTISKGERLVCVGWIESYIPSNEDRHFLFELDAGAKGLLAKHGQSSELDLVFQSYSNLVRRLGD